MSEDMKNKPEESKKVAPVTPVDSMENEIKQAELELKRLEIQAKKAEYQDLTERLAEREMKRENKRQRSVINGQTIKSIQANDEAAQKRCNHRKGGNGAEGVIAGRGDDSQYAVMKHQFANGDIWVRCLRCGKTWKPPLESEFASKAAFEKAEQDYRMALEFQTRNSMSGGVQFRFSDGGENYRKQTASSTLR